jgi:arylsulfatase A-like enzyme
VISIDTLRRDALGRYGGGDTTPFLDQVFENSVALDDFRACANWTLPGMTCAMIGQSTLELGVEPMFPDPEGDPDYLDEDLETLATWMKASGFSTALVSASKLMSDARPIANGFDEVNAIYEAVADWVSTTTIDTITPFLSGTDPWYLHVHFRDPHSPFNPPEAYQGDLAGVDIGENDPRTDEGMDHITTNWRTLSEESLAAVQENALSLYAGEVRYVDDTIANLWTLLSGAGALEHTLVVFWSDHGEQFFEHNRFQHGKSMHVGEAGAIAAFWAHGLTPVAWEGPTLQQDIVPTVLDVFGIAVPETVSGFTVGSAPADRVRISTTMQRQIVPIHSVERHHHRMLYGWDGAMSYYRTDKDPEETNNLYDAENENIGCLWDFLKPAIDMVDAERAGMEPAGVP